MNLGSVLEKVSLIKMTSFFDSVDIKNAVIGAVLFFLIFCLILYLRIRSKHKVLEKENEQFHNLLMSMQNQKGIEDALSELLNLVLPYISAPTYCFYLFDEKNKQYLLKAVRNKTGNEVQIAPNYSGLTPYQKGAYIPPLLLEGDKQPQKIELTKEGEVLMLALPIQGKGQIRIGPMKEAGKGTIKQLNSFTEKIGYTLKVLLELDSLRNKVNVMTTSNQAVQNITTATMDCDKSLETILNLTMKMIHAAGVCLFIQEGDAYRVCHCQGLDEETLALLREDNTIHQLLMEMLKDKSFLALNRDDEMYYQLPSYLAALGIEIMFIVKVNNKINGTAIFWYNEQIAIEQHHLTALRMMMKRLEDIMELNVQVKSLTSSYLDMLKILVQTMDNLDPYTVGYSELMARYTGVIVKELGLSPQEGQDIVTAAYLSNIGILGISTELLFKPGKYTEYEYETMKLHADVGAAIVEATLGNKNIANIIRHHHERIDGYGYPAGLRGDDIPLGSRILAVVQTFLAKINGRKYREALPFEKALELLTTAAGSQLDEDMVKALVNWIRRKQKSPAILGRSLGPCWEMRCVPTNICMGCPAYNNLEKNCWELEGVKCCEHGNTCESCFVFTEYQARHINKNIPHRMAN